MTPPSSDIAIRAVGLGKTYRIYDHPISRVRQMLSLGGKKHYREFEALKDVSFEIRKGETVGIIGRNGSGKSTLLQLICGILKPTHGSVEVNGRVSALLELGAGFHPEFTGRENVYMQGAIMGLTREEMDARFEHIAAFADIGEFIEQPVKTYSSGMFVRLAFAVAVSVEPDVLVVDEALAVGDTLFQARCFQKFREFRERGTTILFVTHSLDLIVGHCQRAVLLDHGITRTSGDSKQVVNIYRNLMARGERSACAMNVMSAESTVSHEYRYGTQESEIIDTAIYTDDGRSVSILDHGERYHVRLRVILHDIGSRPFFSFVVKDPRGVVLYGGMVRWSDATNNNPDNTPTSVVVRFSHLMLLNPGKYLLSAGSQSLDADGTIIAHDIRTDILPFEVVGGGEYGVFSPPLAACIEAEEC